MQIERILITVRTYPTLSKKYQETVCTGGINANGEWRRLHPVQWRMLEEDKQYRQYDIVEARVGLESSDGRPESRRVDGASLRVIERLETWEARVPWVKPTILPSMRALRESGRTISPVRVKEVAEFVAIPCDPEWSEEQREILRQDGLFGGPSPLQKIPFDFRLVWVDGEGEKHDNKFIDWEVCQGWRKFRSRPNALEYLENAWRNKRFGRNQSISFYMGNYKQHPQNFGVCGVFCPPKGLMDEQSLW